MPKVIVNPAWLPKPSGFSHGIEAQGRTLFIAGQTAQDAEGRIAPVGDLVGQFRHALANVGAVVGARGGTLRDLVKVTFYVVDKREYRAKAREIGQVYREMMEGHWPRHHAGGSARSLGRRRPDRDRRDRGPRVGGGKMQVGIVYHTGFTVSDIERSIVFYRDVLGPQAREAPDGHRAVPCDRHGLRGRAARDRAAPARGGRQHAGAPPVRLPSRVGHRSRHEPPR